MAETRVSWFIAAKRLVRPENSVKITHSPWFFGRIVPDCAGIGRIGSDWLGRMKLAINAKKRFERLAAGQNHETQWSRSDAESAEQGQEEMSLMFFSALSVPPREKIFAERMFPMEVILPYIGGNAIYVSRLVVLILRRRGGAGLPGG